MGDDYAREIMRRAIARTCVALGVKTTSLEVIDCLADVSRHYIQSFGLAAADKSESTGRATPGIQDFIYAIGLTKPRTTLTGWKDLIEFAEPEGNKQGWSQPLPYDVQSFPIKPIIKDVPKESQLVDTIIGKIPSHLPKPPPSHTYKKKTKLKRKTVTNSHNDNNIDEKRIKRIEINESIIESLDR